MNPKPVKRKADYYRRWLRGEFGNKPRAWDRLANVDCDPVVVRYLEPGSPYCAYDVPRNRVDRVLARMVRNGADPVKFVFNECMPNDRLALQGELADLPGGLHLFGSTEKVPMRDALGRSNFSEHGLAALSRLRQVMTPSDLADVRALFELYPDHVIEFSTYRGSVGCLPGRHTVIWEVRCY